MRNSFGDLLKGLCRELGISGTELAEAVNYDLSYISKWFSGVKLPSYQNRQMIIANLSKVIVAHMGADSAATVLSRVSDLTEKEVTKDKLSSEKAGSVIAEMLERAYISDYNYMNLRIGERDALSFIDSWEKYCELINTAVEHLKNQNKKRVSIITNFDLIEAWGSRINNMLEALDNGVIEEVELCIGINMDKAVAEYAEYCRIILDSILNLNHVELTINRCSGKNPPILIMDDMLFAEVIYEDNNMFAACYSTNELVIDFYRNAYVISRSSQENVLDYTEPAYLRKTNMQIDSYSDRTQRLFFNEAPALLLPPDIMDELAESTDDANYALYLRKLSTIFEKYTSKAKLDLLLYSSKLNDYVSTGSISIGNVAHNFTPDQVKRHLTYIAECMNNNPDIHIYIYRDTIRMRSGIRETPSIFLNENSLTLENSKVRPNESYHISVDSDFHYMFERFFDDTLNDSYCKEITAEGLLRYL